MNTNGTVVINGEEINGAISSLQSSCANLESDVSAMLPGSFSVLSDLDLYSNALAIIIKQIASLIDSHKLLINQISQHLIDMAQTEDTLTSTFSSGVGNYSGGSGSYSGESTPIDAISVDTTVDSSKPVNSQALIESITKISDEEAVKLLELINSNKPEGTTLNSLLFDSSLSEKLYVLIKSYFGDTSNDLTGVTLDDYKAVQKALIDSIFGKDITIQQLNENSILSAKDYLLSICKENNVNVSDLLLDSSYKETLQTALLNLYDGNGVGKYDVSESTINSFRNYIDNLSKDNNTTYEDLIINKTNLII